MRPVLLLPLLSLLACAEPSRASAPTPPSQAPVAEAGCLADLADLPGEQHGPGASAARTIVVFKGTRAVGLYEGGRLSTRDGQPWCFPAGFGATPAGPKVRADGSSTPEGWYHLARKRTTDPEDAWPPTAWTAGLHVSYPAEPDVARALELGVIDAATARALRDEIASGKLPNQDTPMGGQILIHVWDDLDALSLGCVTVREPELRRLFDAVQERDPILLLPVEVAPATVAAAWTPTTPR